MLGDRACMLQLLLPALIPSWRFFDRIGPAPRVEYALLWASGGRQAGEPEPGTLARGGTGSGAGTDTQAGTQTGSATDASGRRWREVHPRPATVSPLAMLQRLFWNPRRNEALYLVSCAEALLEDPSPARAAHLWEQVAMVVRAQSPSSAPDADTHARLQVRVVVTEREPGHDRDAGRQGGAGAAPASASGASAAVAPGAATVPEPGRLVEQVAYLSEARPLGAPGEACPR